MMNKLISSVVRIWTDMVVIISPSLCRGFYGISCITTKAYTKFSVSSGSVMGVHVALSFKKTKGVITNET